jgi:hypothetical protein
MALIYDVDQTRPLRIVLVHDPDESIYYTIRYRAPAWTATSEKKEATSVDDSGDTVRPTTTSGFYAECTSSGITDTDEPVWPTATGETVTDGTVEWTMHSDDFELEAGDTIQSSSWTADSDDVTMDNAGSDDDDVWVRVTAVPDASYFVLTNELEILRSNGNTEVINRSIRVKIKEK